MMLLLKYNEPKQIHLQFPFQLKNVNGAVDLDIVFPASKDHDWIVRKGKNEQTY